MESTHYRYRGRNVPNPEILGVSSCAGLIVPVERTPGGCKDSFDVHVSCNNCLFGHGNSELKEKWARGKSKSREIYRKLEGK